MSQAPGSNSIAQLCEQKQVYEAHPKYRADKGDCPVRDLVRECQQRVIQKFQIPMEPVKPTIRTAGRPISMRGLSSMLSHAACEQLTERLLTYCAEHKVSMCYPTAKRKGDIKIAWRS